MDEVVFYEGDGRPSRACLNWVYRASETKIERELARLQKQRDDALADLSQVRETATAVIAERDRLREERDAALSDLDARTEGMIGYRDRMVENAREVDRLRARVAELEAQAPEPRPEDPHE